MESMRLSSKERARQRLDVGSFLRKSCFARLMERERERPARHICTPPFVLPPSLAVAMPLTPPSLPPTPIWASV